MGSALYSDRYCKVNGEWKIAYTGYKRLYEEVQPRGPEDKILLKPIN
jgi:hypothetical protein